MDDATLAYMKLLHSATSPFVRKVLVAAMERGLDATIERVATSTLPTKCDPRVSEHNPASKIPVLITDEGETLFDSRVILEYLDGLGERPPLIPQGAKRYRALVLQSLGDEALDASVLLRYETFLRPEALRWPDWIAAQQQKIDATLDLLESRYLEHLRDELDVGVIAVGCLLGYLHLRFAELGWRRRREGLAAWYQTFSARDSMKATEPK